MRICLVTPFAWSRPHEVNEHVAGIAAALRELDHDVTILAPSNRAGGPSDVAPELRPCLSTPTSGVQVGGVLLVRGRSPRACRAS